MIDSDLLQHEAAAMHIALDSVALERFQVFAKLLVEWNQKMNLTGITDPEGIVYKHFLDSLSFLPYVQLPQGASLIDVGTGAGFPGIPLLIARPDLKITLLDSLKKRLTFLEAVLDAAGLNAATLHSRSEEAGQQPAYREQFDFATARAVAALPTLCEYCLPFVRKGGLLIAMKGREMEEEQAAAHQAVTLLGGALEHPIPLTIPVAGERNLILVEKISQTPSKYPRTSAKIAKSPL